MWMVRGLSPYLQAQALKLQITQREGRLSMAREKLLCYLLEEPCPCLPECVFYSQPLHHESTQIQREGKYIMPLHFTRSPSRQAGCLVGTPSYLIYLVLARGASTGFVFWGGKKPPSPLPHLINGCKLFLRLYFSCSTTLISNPNNFASKSNLLN